MGSWGHPLAKGAEAMFGMTTKHWAVIAGFLVALASQIAGLGDSWDHVSSPMFVAGVIGQLGTVLAAVFVGAPDKPGGE